MDEVGLDSSNVLSMAVNGSYIFAGTRTGGLFLSTDNGVSWISTANGLSIYSLAFVGTDIFTGTYGGGVLRSTDYGANWLAVNNGLTDGRIVSLLVTENNIFTGTENGVFISNLTDINRNSNK